jgi:hypothetical protein
MNRWWTGIKIGWTNKGSAERTDAKKGRRQKYDT